MKRRDGFTLIELVVVILILGILAGVAAPKMFDTSGKARENGLKQSLAIVRDAIELHTSQVGTPPPCTDAAGADFKLALKAYIRGPFPKSHLAAAGDQDKVKPIGTPGALTSDNTFGWMYNTITGEFIINSNAATSASGVLYNAL